MEVIAVGTAAIDVVHEVTAYPEEDAKARSLGTWKCRGGNAANALVVCSQLGGRCRWLSTSTDPANDNDAAFIHADMAGFGVDCSLAVIETEGSMPVSYILASRATGSRTIVHSRTIAELSCEAFAKQLERYLKEVRRDINAPLWIHFEGRNMEVVRQMMLHLRATAPQAKISVEIEFPRYPWSLAKTLASIADYVFISKDYLRSNVNLSTAQEFFEGILAQQWDEKWDHSVKAFICPWGAEGVYYLEMAGSTTHHIPAARLDHVMESNGAGDTFIGAALAGLSRGNVSLHFVMKTACDVATIKCSQRGFNLPSDKTISWKQQLDRLEDDSSIDAESISKCTNQEQYAQLDALDDSLGVVSTAHSVTSEVELELDQVQSTAETYPDSEHLFIVRLLPTYAEDEDGDIVVPRRREKKRRGSLSGQGNTAENASLQSRNQIDGMPSSATRGTETTFVLGAHIHSTWDTAGTQLWRAAFLLAEFIYSAPHVFKDQTVLELGCGIGKTLLMRNGLPVSEELTRVAMHYAKKVSLLSWHQDFEKRQPQPSRTLVFYYRRLKFRLFNWGDASLRSTGDRSSPSTFNWTTNDLAELEDLTVIIASDVFYDDATTTLFLRALHRLMFQYKHAKAYISLERRSVFSAAAMRVVSLGYDTFQDHICFHDSSACHTRVSENQVRCRICSTTSLPNTGRDYDSLVRFLVHKIDIGEFPQRFKYDRLSTLMLWMIDAIVVC